MYDNLILDFTKLFPNSCANKGILDFRVNLDDIKYFKRQYTAPVGIAGDTVLEDVLQIGQTTFRFPAIDTGIITLNAIIAAKNMLRVYSSDTFQADDDQQEFARKKAITTRYLNECIIKYGVDPAP